MHAESFSVWMFSLFFFTSAHYCNVKCPCVLQVLIYKSILCLFMLYSLNLCKSILCTEHLVSWTCWKCEQCESLGLNTVSTIIFKNLQNYNSRKVSNVTHTSLASRPFYLSSLAFPRMPLALLKWGEANCGYKQE